MTHGAKDIDRMLWTLRDTEPCGNEMSLVRELEARVDITRSMSVCTATALQHLPCTPRNSCDVLELRMKSYVQNRGIDASITDREQTMIINISKTNKSTLNRTLDTSL